MAGVRYDPKVLRRHAGSLYAQARLVVALAVGVGVVVWGAGGYVVGVRGGFGGLAAVVGAVIGGAIGYAGVIGAATMMRVWAQDTLCFLHTEQNTRALVKLQARSAKALERLEAHSTLAETRRESAEDEREPCPRCAERILPAARVCRFCGAKLRMTPAEAEEAAIAARIAAARRKVEG